LIEIWAGGVKHKPVTALQLAASILTFAFRINLITRNNGGI
jgi:hypothetical protein